MWVFILVPARKMAYMQYPHAQLINACNNSFMVQNLNTLNVSSIPVYKKVVESQVYILCGMSLNFIYIYKLEDVCCIIDLIPKIG